jgi:AhpD family alkylhydroperoxidase
MPKWIFQKTSLVGFIQILIWLLALEASELVSEPVTQMAVELINIHLISVQQKCKCCILFHVKTTTKK